MVTKQVDEITAGDVLAGDVVCGDNRLLAKAGVTLGDTHIRVFRMRGVKSVEVADRAGEGDDESIGPDMNMLKDRASAELTVQFGKRMDNEVMAEIFRVGVEMRAGILAAAEVK